MAAYNAASWCNLKLSYEQVEKYARACGYSYRGGIYFFQFANLVKKLGIPAKKVKPKSIDDIESRLYLGKFFIFLYTAVGAPNGHAIVAFTDHEGNIMLINPDQERITWGDFASDVYSNGMKNFIVYEIPCREMVKQNDVSGTN